MGVRGKKWIDTVRVTSEDLDALPRSTGMPCPTEGCTKPVRTQGLFEIHYRS